MSFIAAMQKVKQTLEDDTPLQDFATLNLGKALPVKFAYKNRAELNVADLPVIILTRPTVKKRFQSGVRDAAHSLTMYVVFQQDDRELGPLQLVELEEHIDDAIIKDISLGGSVISAIPDDSANDEGKNHPIYCMVLSMEIQHRRFT